MASLTILAGGLAFTFPKRRECIEIDVGYFVACGPSFGYVEFLNAASSACSSDVCDYEDARQFNRRNQVSDFGNRGFFATPTVSALCVAQRNINDGLWIFKLHHYPRTG